VTTEVYAAAPHYRRVEVMARVIARPDVNSADIAKALQDRLLSYFSPLNGGADGTGWGFGDAVYFSEVFRLILTTPGVLRLPGDALTLYVDGEPRTGDQARADVPLRPDELVYSQRHTVTVSYS
jgi:hypothetical protein